MPFGVVTACVSFANYIHVTELTILLPENCPMNAVKNAIWFLCAWHLAVLWLACVDFKFFVN